MSKDKIEAMICLTFQKIHELEGLLHRESKLIGIDLSNQIDAVYNRQKEVVDRAMSFIGKNHQKKIFSSVQPTINQPTDKPGAWPKAKENFTISKSKSLDHKSLSNITINTKSNLRANNTQIVSRNDSSWYGSLDRNVFKKKKGKIDTDSKNYKTIGGRSQELKTELKPDQHYYSGIPVAFLTETENLPKLSLRDTSLQKQKRYESRSRSFQSNPNLPITSNVFTSKYVTGNSDDVDGNVRQSTDKSKQSIWLETSIDESTTRPVEVFQKHIAQNRTELRGNAESPASGPPRKYHGWLPTPSKPAEQSEKTSLSGDSGELRFHSESSKPFEMSDYYKYSTKFKRVSGVTDSVLSKSDPPALPQKLSTKICNPSSAKDQHNKANIEYTATSITDPNGNTHQFRFTSKHQGTPPRTHDDNRLYKSLLPNAEIDPLDDELAWVMDAPTLV